MKWSGEKNNRQTDRWMYGRTDRHIIIIEDNTIIHTLYLSNMCNNRCRVKFLLE